MQNQSKPILLFNSECGVCRSIANWVQRSGQDLSGDTRIVEKAIGEDPAACLALNPKLNIWDAYATIHLLMPDGSMKTGGEAVAEVLRTLPNTRWFSGVFNVRLFGRRPFQALLNLAYAILADVRPLFGCESCGTPSGWLRPFAWMVKQGKRVLGKGVHVRPHFTHARRPVLASRARTPSQVGMNVVGATT